MPNILFSYWISFLCFSFVVCLRSFVCWSNDDFTVNMSSHIVYMSLHTNSKCALIRRTTSRSTSVCDHSKNKLHIFKHFGQCKYEMCSNFVLPQHKIFHSIDMMCFECYERFIFDTVQTEKEHKETRKNFLLKKRRQSVELERMVRQFYHSIHFG